MGLDVYLRKCPDMAAAKSAEDGYEAATDGIYVEGVSDDQRKAKRLEAAAKFGTDEWGTHASRDEISEASVTAPEHMFKIGYWRSSYNGSGIDSVMRKLGLPSLSAIMGTDGDEYELVPDWDASLVRVNAAIAGYEAHLAGDAGKFSVMELCPMFEFGAQNEKAALDLFMEQLRQERGPGWDSFSNRDGEYYLKGIKVLAFIPKMFKRPTNPIEAIIGGPTVFVVYEKEPEAGGDWHLAALKIVRETIEYVLAQPDKATYYLAWSG